MDRGIKDRKFMGLETTKQMMALVRSRRQPGPDTKKGDDEGVVR